MGRAASDIFLRVITDAAEMGFALLDDAGRVTLWNSWLATASEVSAIDALGHTLAEIFPAQPVEAVLRAVAAALDKGEQATLATQADLLPLPLFRRGGRDGRREAMQQVVTVKGLGAGGGRSCLVQVLDVSAMAAREGLLRQQARTMEALAENYRLSELHNRAIVDNTADAIVTFGEDGAIGTYNPSAERIFGYLPHEIAGKPINRLIPQLIKPESYLDHRTEVMGLRKEGDPFPLELSLAAMELGGQRLFVAIGHDITLRKANEAELHTQKEWLTTLINTLPDLVCFKDGEGRWLVANRFYLDMVGLAGVDYVGRTGPELAAFSAQSRDFLAGAAETDERAWQEGRPLTYEKTLPVPGHSAKIFDMHKIPLFHADGSRRGLVLVGRDVTERKMAAARIQHLAHHDSLTELPNRALFHERLRQSMAQAKRHGDRLALMFLDLDKFKDINDTLGHHVGDLLLRAVSKRLNRCVRETDMVARLGGDEFAVILTNLESTEGAARVAESIIDGVAEPFGLEEHEVLTSTSIGITVFPDDSEDADQLLKNADLAMFRAKAEGRKSYRFYVAQMDAEVRARKVLERDLRAAMGTDQLELHYQPLVEMSSRRIIGCEALIRWRHPERGWISPGEFIPVAERSDLIGPLGLWILERACRQARQWLDLGLPAMKVAVNLSPAQFKQPGTVVPMVARAIADAGIGPEQLQLEITEGIAMQNVDATIEVLQALRAMGVLISIDDFGTGYSSLNYLKRFPVDKLKIDRSFVVDIGLHPDNAAVVEAIVNLGHSLGTRVNVEGIETREQLDFLMSHNVDEAQGFYFAKALPADDFAQLVRTKSPWPL